MPAASLDALGQRLALRHVVSQRGNHVTPQRGKWQPNQTTDQTNPV